MSRRADGIKLLRIYLNFQMEKYSGSRSSVERDGETIWMRALTSNEVTMLEVTGLMSRIVG